MKHTCVLLNNQMWDRSEYPTKRTKKTFFKNIFTLTIPWWAPSSSHGLRLRSGNRHPINKSVPPSGKNLIGWNIHTIVHVILYLCIPLNTMLMYLSYTTMICSVILLWRNIHKYNSLPCFWNKKLTAETSIVINKPLFALRVLSGQFVFRDLNFKT